MRNINKNNRLSLLLLVLITLAPQASAFTIDFNVFHSLLRVHFGHLGQTAGGEWEDLLIKLKDETDEVKLEQVNRFVNQKIRYGSDQLIWKVNDYWATPMQSFGKGRGDCEDYVIAKYVSLRSLGFSDEQLRLIYVELKTGSITEAHMVLGFYKTPESIPLILDNTISSIRPATERIDLKPVFSFNSEGLWSGNRKTDQNPLSRMSRWRDLLERLNQEGISPKR